MTHYTTNADLDRMERMERIARIQQEREIAPKTLIIQALGAGAAIFGAGAAFATALGGLIVLAIKHFA